MLAERGVSRPAIWQICPEAWILNGEILEHPEDDPSIERLHSEGEVKRGGRLSQRVVEVSTRDIQQVARLHPHRHHNATLHSVDHGLCLIAFQGFDGSVGAIFVDLPDLLALELDREDLVEIAMAVEGSNVLEGAIDVRARSAGKLVRQHGGDLPDAGVDVLDMIADQARAH